MTCTVILTENAQKDLEEIGDYIAEHDSRQRADYVIGEIEKVVASIANFPLRGSYPPELLEHGIRDYREVFFKPYRVIYEADGKTVVVYIVADGRRDMETLLQLRLLTSRE